MVSLLALLALAACDHITTPDAGEPDSIALYPSKAALEEGDLVQLQVTDANKSGAQAASGVSVEWQTSDPTVATVSNGMVRGVKPGQARISARTQSGKTAEATIEVGRTPSEIVLLTDGELEAEVGWSLEEPLEARVLSARGLPVAGAEVRFRVTKGAGSVSPVIAVADEDGIVRSEWRLGPVAGEQVVELEAVTHNGTRAAVQAEARPGAPDRIVVSPSEVSLRLGAPFQFAASVTDRYGNKLASIPVQWSSTNPDVVRVNVEGWVTGIAPGTAVVEAVPATGNLTAASAALVEQVAASPGKGKGKGQANVTVESSDDGGSDAQVSVTSGDGQTGVVGTTLGEELGIRVTDSDGTPVRQFEVTWTVVEGDGAVSRTTTRTDGQGRASVEWTLGPVAGTQRVEAQAGDLGSVTFRAEALVGPVEIVTVSPGSGTIEVGEEMGFSASAEDKFGNPIEGSLNATWSVADGSTASVSSNGQAKGLAAGTTQVVASVEGVSGDADLTVEASSSDDDGGGDSSGDGSGDSDSDSGDGDSDSGDNDSGSGDNDSDSGGDDSGSGDGDSDSDDNDSGSDGGDSDSGGDDSGSGDGDSGSGDSDSDSGGDDDGGEETTNPGQVTDLAVTGTTESSATLRFTEVDDGTGNPAQYNIRYHLHPIEWGWGQATHVEEGSCATPVQGQAVGSELTCVAEGLDPDVKYDFQLVAFRVEDGKRVFGTLSHVATGTTTKSDLDVDAVAEVRVTEDEVAFSALGEEVTLEATALNEDGGTVSGASIEWTSTDEEVVIVNSAGTVLAKGIGIAMVVAAASCCDAAAADSVVVHVEQKVAAVEVDPSSVTLEEGKTRQLSAVALDANGFLVADVEFSWSSSDTGVASVSPNGGLKAESQGNANVTARVDGVDGASAVTVQEEGGGSSGDGSADRPNEPSGYSPWFSHDFSYMPNDGNTIAASHAGYIHPQSTLGNYSVVSAERNAPHGKSSELRVKYADGHRDGSGPGTWNARDKAGPREDATPLQEWYIHAWVMLEGDDWEAPPNELKLWYQGKGNYSHTNAGGAFTLRTGIASTAVREEFSHYRQNNRPYYRSAHDPTHIHEPPPVGEWIRLEVAIELSDPDQENGRLRVWINGVQKEDRAVQNQSADDWTVGFYQLHVASIFGGHCSSGCPKTRDDYVRWADVYISGVPQR